jgi:hypothetical protein
MADLDPALVAAAERRVAAQPPLSREQIDLFRRLLFGRGPRSSVVEEESPGSSGGAEAGGPDAAA